MGVAPASVFADVELRLSALGVPGAWLADAEQTLKGHLKDLSRSPRSLPFMAAALDRALNPPQRLVVAGDPSDAGVQALLSVGRDRWLPDLDRLAVEPGKPLPGDAEGFALINGKPAAYLCRGFVCETPLTDPAELRERLGMAG